MELSIKIRPTVATTNSLNIRGHTRFEYTLKQRSRHCTRLVTATRHYRLTKVEGPTEHLACLSRRSCTRIFTIYSFLSSLGVFAKFRIATIKSVRPYGTTLLPQDAFLWIWIFENFSRICWENSSFIKKGWNIEYFTWSPIHTFRHISLGSS